MEFGFYCAKCNLARKTCDITTAWLWLLTAAHHFIYHSIMMNVTRPRFDQSTEHFHGWSYDKRPLSHLRFCRSIGEKRVARLSSSEMVARQNRVILSQVCIGVISNTSTSVDYLALNGMTRSRPIHSLSQFRQKHEPLNHWLWPPCVADAHIIFLSSIFYHFSSPILSRRRLDVYHTSTHGVALVRI